MIPVRPFWAETIPVDCMLDNVVDYIICPTQPTTTAIVVEPAATVLKSRDVMNIVVVYYEVPCLGTIGAAHVQAPTITPPQSDANVPGNEIPPSVPAGTGRRVVIRSGGLAASEPNSDARVSPAQAAR